MVPGLFIAACGLLSSYGTQARECMGSVVVKGSPLKGSLNDL